MKRLHLACFAAVFAALHLSCSPSHDVTSAGDVQDAATSESGSVDADLASDAGDALSIHPNDILGTFGPGACPLVSSQLGSASPSIARDKLVFANGEAWDRASLSPDGQRMWGTPNAGGSSLESEIMSLEILHFCEGASLYKTETEVQYAPPDDAGVNAITDLVVTIGGQRVGVSVTRAYKPPSQTLTDADVRSLLEKKLEGIRRSSVRVLPADRWVKQILHVFCATASACDAVERVYASMDAKLRADTIVLVTETSGGGFIYCNPDPPLGQECQ